MQVKPLTTEEINALLYPCGELEKCFGSLVTGLERELSLMVWNWLGKFISQFVMFRAAGLQDSCRYMVDFLPILEASVKKSFAEVFSLSINQIEAKEHLSSSQNLAKTRSYSSEKCNYGKQLCRKRSSISIFRNYKPEISNQTTSENFYKSAWSGLLKKKIKEDEKVRLNQKSSHYNQSCQNLDERIDSSKVKDLLNKLADKSAARFNKQFRKKSEQSQIRQEKHLHSQNSQIFKQDARPEDPHTHANQNVPELLKSYEKKVSDLESLMHTKLDNFISEFKKSQEIKFNNYKQPGLDAEPKQRKSAAIVEQRGLVKHCAKQPFKNLKKASCINESNEEILQSIDLNAGSRIVKSRDFDISISVQEQERSLLNFMEIASKVMMPVTKIFLSIFHKKYSEICDQKSHQPHKEILNIEQVSITPSNNEFIRQSLLKMKKMVDLKCEEHKKKLICAYISSCINCLNAIMLADSRTTADEPQQLHVEIQRVVALFNSD